MRRLPVSLVCLATVVAGCSSGAADAGTSGRTASQSSATTPSPVSSPSPSTLQVPTSCASSGDQQLSKQEAGGCYLALIGMTNTAVPGVTIQMGTDAKDLETVRRKAQEAVDAITVVSRGLRTTKWPASISALCVKLAARFESFLPAMRRIAQASTVEEAQAAFQQFEQVRGPTGPVPEAVVIRQRLGLPPV